MAKSTEEKKEGLKEVEFSVSIKGLVKGWTRLFYDTPMGWYQTAARKLDTLSEKGRTGYLAAVTMPLGIMLRNGARVAHGAVKGRYDGFAHWLGGAPSAAAAGWIAGTAAFGAVTGLPFVTGLAGSIGAGVVAAVAAAPILVPAFTAGTLLAATGAATVATTVSVIGTALNLPVGLRRSIAAFKGEKIDDKTLNDKRVLRSLETDHERETYNEVRRGLLLLTDEHRETIYKGLQEEFGEAAADARGEEVEQTPTPAPAAAKPQTPKA